MTEETREGFVWPPKPLGRGQTAVATPEAPPRRSWIGDLERLWLGRPDAGTWEERRAELELTPEPRDAACPRCAGSVGPGEVTPEGCGTCRSLSLGWSRAIRLGRFDGELREAVLDLKYRAWRGIGASLGGLLGRRLRQDLERAGIDPAEALIVPVPTRRWRRITRNGGVDHSRTLAVAAGRDAGVRVVPALRRRPGPSQTGLTATARAENAKSLYETRIRELPDARLVILIDDVRTTGATLTACSRLIGLALQAQAGESVTRIRPATRERLWVATVAVAREGRRRDPASGEEKDEELEGGAA